MGTLFKKTKHLLRTLYSVSYCQQNAVWYVIPRLNSKMSKCLSSSTCVLVEGQPIGLAPDGRLCKSQLVLLQHPVSADWGWALLDDLAPLRVSFILLLGPGASPGFCSQGNGRGTGNGQKYHLLRSKCETLILSFLPSSFGQSKSLGQTQSQGSWK